MNNISNIKDEIDKKISIIKKLCIALISMFCISLIFVFVCAGLLFSYDPWSDPIAISSAITAIGAIDGLLWFATLGVWLAIAIMTLVNADEIKAIYPRLNNLFILGILILFFSLIPTCVLLAKLKQSNLVPAENYEQRINNISQQPQQPMYYQQPSPMMYQQPMQQPMMYQQPSPMMQPQQQPQSNSFNISQELEQLKFLRDNNEITQEQYDELKAKIIAKIG